MKLEGLLNAENLPDDLHWVAHEYHLQPNDPVFLLIAWHWAHTRKAEDTLRAAHVELKAALDSRIKTITGAADKVDALAEKLTRLETALTPKPAAIAKDFDAAVRPGLTAIAQNIAGLEKSSAALAFHAQAAVAAANRRQIMAGVVAGVAFGITVAVLVAIR